MTHLVLRLFSPKLHQPDHFIHAVHTRKLIKKKKITETIILVSRSSESWRNRTNWVLTLVPFLRCDAKERSGCELLRGVQVLQTGDHQEPHRAPLHDRTPQGERARTRTDLRETGTRLFFQQIRELPLKPGCTVCVCFQSESYQEDIYPMTAGNRPALSAEEWLSGIDKGAMFRLHRKRRESKTDSGCAP